MIDWARLYRMGRASARRCDALASASVQFAADYGLTTPARAANFMGQAAHETEGFVYLREIWGPTPTQLTYAHRNGNSEPGDGKRYRGRGIFQVTGRANYAAAARRFATDFTAFPELLENEAWAVRTAMDFWVTHGCAALADAGDTDAISRKINGAHCCTLLERRGWVTKMKTAFVTVKEAA